MPRAASKDALGCANGNGVELSLHPAMLRGPASVPARNSEPQPFAALRRDVPRLLLVQGTPFNAGVPHAYLGRVFPEPTTPIHTPK